VLIPDVPECLLLAVKYLGTQFAKMLFLDLVEDLLLAWVAQLQHLFRNH
jgi:hypothetical protein